MANTTDLSTGAQPIPTQPASGWYLVWGLLLIGTGILAVLMPMVAALATALFFGWLLILGGVCEIVYAVQTRGHEHFGWKLLSGVLTLVLGLAIVLVPLAGAASLALLVGAFLFVGGIVRTMLALRFRPRRGWGWVLFDGLLSIVLALLIATGWPESSIAFIGLLTGFVLISAGVWRIVLHRLAVA
ncbi:MAG TPA: HdeD family acid-resistance protein [Burkholderiaceae bacterium]